MPLRKPTFMPNEVWAEFTKKYDFRPSCEDCKDGNWERDDLTVDHRVPRIKGGGNDLGNLCCRCRHHNSAKGTKPDAYWETPRFYFDTNFNADALRALQRFAFETIHSARDPEGKLWFTHDWSQINRVIYMIAAIVASGKTMAIPAVGFALNSLVQQFGFKGQPRIDRTLVLVKDMGLRDQMVRDLQEDIVKYGICARPPEVGVVENGNVLDTPGALEKYDIVVGCAQSLWQTASGPRRRNLSHVLGQFPLIFSDELHFAEDQVQGIVEQALTSLMFGLTASPIEANGNLKNRFIRLNVWGWQEANCHDQSLKLIPSDSQLEHHLEEIDIEYARFLDHGKLRETKNVREPHYDEQLDPIKSVADALVKYLHDSDQEFQKEGRYTLAAHRKTLDNVDHDVQVPYFMHGILYIPNRKLAEPIKKYLQAKFEEDRTTFPLEKGWDAVYVCSGDDKIEGNHLTDDSPWLMYKNTGKLVSTNGKKPKYAARILIGIDMPKEGVNNPFCGVVAIADGVKSIRDMIQRLGRPARAVKIETADGKVRFPPARQDAIHIITHKTYGNRPVISRALTFMLNMRTELEAIPDLSRLMQGKLEPPTTTPIDPNASLHAKDKMAILDDLARAEERGEKKPSIEAILDRHNANGGPSRAKLIRELYENADKDRALIHKEHFVYQITPIPTLTLEIPSVNPSDEQLAGYLRQVGQAHLVGSLKEPNTRLGWEHAYRAHTRNFHRGAMPEFTSLDQIRKTDIAGAVRDRLGKSVDWGNRNAENALHTWIGFAVKTKLGAPEGAKKNSPYDNIRCHTLLLAPDHFYEMVKFVCTKIVQSGYARHLAKYFGVPERYRNGADGGVDMGEADAETVSLA